MLRPTPPRESLHVRVLLGWVTRAYCPGDGRYDDEPDYPKTHFTPSFTIPPADTWRRRDDDHGSPGRRW
jgi:hypothetical protein